MKVCTRIALTVLIIGTALFYQKFRSISAPLAAPTLDEKQFWGPGDSSLYVENTEVVPKEIFYEKELITDLITRLNTTWKYRAPLQEVAFEYGFNSGRLQQVVDYWRDVYLQKWNERVERLNVVPHYSTEIQGLHIHFIHLKVDDPKGRKVRPVLLLHGWPGSVIEFYDFIALMLDDDDNKDVVFEIVLPSLPGYGWSEGTTRQGLGPAEMAVIFKNLMERLNYTQFYVQGGDWGSLIGSNLATLYPKKVLGFHSNFCGVQTPVSMLKTTIAAYLPGLFVEDKYKDFYFPVSKALGFMLVESGYMHLQATKPDTIGIALTDNPIGLAAYLLEKFSTWTHPDFRKAASGGFERDFTIDSLLDNVMIYYMTNSISTSVRLYAEAFTADQMAYNLDRVATNVPVACARFRHEMMHQIDWVIKDKFTNIVQSSHFENGGHFAAFQLPETLFNDFISFVEKVEN